MSICYNAVLKYDGVLKSITEAEIFFQAFVTLSLSLSLSLSVKK